MPQSKDSSSFPHTIKNHISSHRQPPQQEPRLDLAMVSKLAFLTKLPNLSSILCIVAEIILLNKTHI